MNASAKGKGKAKAHDNQNGSATGVKRSADREHNESPKRKKVKFAVEEKPEPKASVKENVSGSSRQNSKSATVDKKKKGPTPLEKLAARSDPSSSVFVEPPRKGRTQQEKEEDAYIKYLESKLGWAKGGKKTSKYGKDLEEDGLDGRWLVSTWGWNLTAYHQCRLDLLRDIDNIEASIFSSAPVSLDKSIKMGGYSIGSDRVKSTIQNMTKKIMIKNIAAKMTMRTRTRTRT